MMSNNSHCGPDIVKYFVVEPANDVVTGATGNFFVCSGTTFLSTISGCTDSVDFNGNIFYNNSDVFFNGVITACTGIHTSNIYGCSPITVHDELILLNKLTLSAVTQDNTLTQILARDSSTGEVKYRDVESIISAATSQDTFVSGGTYNEGTTSIDFSGNSVETTFSVSLSGISSNIDIYNTYFVSPTGDDSTAVRGDLHSPFKTITAARNKVVAELSTSTVTGGTLIHVYSGEYTEEEIQYENGNFYFEPNSIVTMTPTLVANASALFKLGSTPTKVSNIYSATTCNVYGYGIFVVSASTDGGVGGTVLDLESNSVSSFEFDIINIENGLGINSKDVSTLHLEGNDINVDITADCIAMQNGSKHIINVNKVVGGSGHWGFHYSDYSGTSLVNISEILGKPSFQPIGFSNTKDGAEIVVNFNKLSHEPVGTQFVINNSNQQGGKITLNGNIEAQRGIVYGQTCTGGEFNYNGDIVVNEFPILNSFTGPHNGNTFFYNGNIISNGNNSNGSIQLKGGTSILNGSLTNNTFTGNTNGVSIASNPTDLKIGNFDINVNNESITSTASQTVEILHSLNVNKPINSNITTTGLFNYTGTTNVGDLVIYNTPTNDNVLTQILGRNSTTGVVEYRDVSTIAPAAKLQNTYFVSSLSGDNSTALVGDINNPWKTITEARNQAVSDGLSNSLIHVYSGEYFEDEIQYENGNFYFEPNSKVITQRTSSGGTTSIFKLGATLVYASNAYSANTCNVYGYGDFSVSATTDTDSYGGVVLSMLGDSNSYFEFNDVYAHSGVGFYAGGNSVLTLEGHDILLDPSGSDGLDFGDTSTTLINVNNIVGGNSHYNIHYRQYFAGKSVVNFNKLIGSDQLIAFDRFMQPTAEITMNFNLIEHTGGSQFIINSGDNLGGKVTLNGDFYAPYGNGILLFHDDGEYNINGNITCRDTALLSVNALTPSNNFVLNYDGDIVTSGVTSDFSSNGGIELYKITANLNGSLTNLSLGSLSNGINIDGDSILSIDNFDINVASGNTIGTSSSNVVNINHSLSINKPFSAGITTTGLFNYTGTTNVGDLVIYNTPTNDNTLTQILGRNSTTGNIEYRSVESIITGATSQDTFVTGFTFNNSTYDLTIKQNEGQPDLVSNLAVLATDVYVVSGVYNPATGIVTYTNSSGGTFQVSGFTTGMTDSYTTDAYINGTEIRFDNNIQGANFYNVDLNPLLSGKTNNTTFNTYTANTQTILDGKIDSANNLGGANEFFKDKSGTTLNFRTLSGGSNTTVSTVGDIVKVDVTIPTDTNTFTTGFTYNDSNTLTITDNDGGVFNASINTMTGLTVNGTLSATTYFGDGSNLTGISSEDNFVTGGTFSSETLTLDRQNGSVTITGFTSDSNTFVTGYTYNDSNTFTISNNDGSNYSASINVMTGLTINGESTGTTLTVNGQSVFSGSSTDVLQIYGSGSTSPLFRIEGSSGELFSVSDSLIGDLFTVNNISGLPILVVNSDNTILWGDNTVPSLNTTVKKSINSGLSEIYSIPVSAYTGGFFDYTITGAGARAGSITSIFSGTSVQFNETTTNDIGDTSGITFDMNISGGTANLTVSATTNSWEIRTIVRSI